MSDSRVPLNEQLLRTALIDQGPFARLDYSHTTGSTNADLLVASQSGSPSWTVATVESQNSGRGRLGRLWSAPTGSQVIFSVLFRPPTSTIENLGTLPLASGLAVLDTLAEFKVPNSGLKWPNDVLINGKKLCGILVEAVSLESEPAVIIGIGTNISLSRDELPVQHATSLELEGCTVDRNDFLISVLGNIYKRIHAWQQGDVQWLNDYRHVCTSLEQDVRVILPGDNELLGRAIGVTDKGQLQVRDNDGQLHTLNAGEVTHLRLQ